MGIKKTMFLPSVNCSALRDGQITEVVFDEVDAERNYTVNIFDLRLLSLVLHSVRRHSKWAIQDPSIQDPTIQDPTILIIALLGKGYKVKYRYRINISLHYKYTINTVHTKYLRILVPQAFLPRLSIFV